MARAATSYGQRISFNYSIVAQLNKLNSQHPDELEEEK